MELWYADGGRVHPGFDLGESKVSCTVAAGDGRPDRRLYSASHLIKHPEGLTFRDGGTCSCYILMSI